MNGYIFLGISAPADHEVVEDAPVPLGAAGPPGGEVDPEHGLPAGGDLDYADQATLISALQWRREM